VENDGKSGLTSMAQPEMSVLSVISKSEVHQDVIKHPVIKSFVWMKWLRIQRFYHRDLRADVLLLWFLTWYIFTHFGGLEWTNTCQNQADNAASQVLKSIQTQPDQLPDPKTPVPSNVTEFCKQIEQKKRSNKKYGELEILKVAEKLSYNLGGISKKFDFLNVNKHEADSPICLYGNTFYIVFIVIAGALLYWMWVDAKTIFSSSNLDERRYTTATTNTFFSNVVPLGRDIVIFLIILAVAAFSNVMLWFGISVIFFFNMLRELSQFVVTPLAYFTRISNWADMSIIVLVTMVVYVPNQYIPDPTVLSLSETIEKVCHDGGLSNYSGQDEKDVSVKRSLSAFLIVITWTRFIFQFARHPGKKLEMWNKYALMYKRVASSFLKLLAVYSTFIIAFAIGFYVMFHNDIGDLKLDMGKSSSLSSYNFFNTPYETVAKTIAMFIGEVDFNNMPIGISYARRDGNFSATLAYLFFLLFIFMSVLVLMNLLNGLAVEDISELIKCTDVEHQISMIDILTEYEESSQRIRKVLATLTKCIPGVTRFVIKTLDIGEELTLFPINDSSDDVESQADNIGDISSIKEESPNSENSDSKLQLKKQMSIISQLTKNRKRIKKLPNTSTKDAQTKNNTDKNSWMYKYFGKEQTIGCEHILSEARDILLDSNKTNIQQLLKTGGTVATPEMPN
jgi:hypothetical protein